MGAAPWQDVVAGMPGQLEKLVDEFRRAEALAPAGKQALVAHVTAHEQALLDFARREVGGDGETSLEPVLALLRTPPVI